MESPTIVTPEKKPETASAFCERIKAILRVPGKNVQVQLLGMYAEGNLWEFDTTLRTIDLVQESGGLEVRVSITGLTGEAEFYISNDFNTGEPVFTKENEKRTDIENTRKIMSFILP